MVMRRSALVFLILWAGFVLWRGDLLPGAARADGAAPEERGVKVIERTPDSDGDGYFETLVLEASLPAEAGTYIARATLSDAGGRVVALGQGVGSPFEAAASPAMTIRSDGRAARLTARFDGEEIRRAGMDGPYRLQVVLQPQDSGTAAVFTARTNRYRSSQFGRLPARIVDARLRLDENQIRIDVDVDVSRPGEYMVEGTAWVAETLIGRGEQTGVRRKGMHREPLVLGGVAVDLLGRVRSADSVIVEAQLFQGETRVDSRRSIEAVESP
jgi:hypothetical protein